MLGNKYPYKENVEKGVEEITVVIATKIREQSENLGKLTSVDSLGILLPELEPDKIEVNLAEVIRDSRYPDIKSILTSTGAVYLYSETYITESQADILVRAEDNKVRITEKVREESKNLAKLTSVDSLVTLVSDLKPDEVEADFAELLKDSRYPDIRSILASTGAVYLYSETYITKSYADALVLAEANDPCATIAAMVRDEARIYPRATRIEFFKNPIFNINPDELEGHLVSTLECPEFKDIKLIDASTGARYLYSELYMDEDYARSLVEWEEVGQEENP
ncbi:hypothetical protein ACFLYF_04645 [Chloroflexota bacterium]